MAGQHRAAGRHESRRQSGDERLAAGESATSALAGAVALDRADAVVDRGTWTASLGTYTLTSGLRPRALTLTSPDTGRLLSAERMVTYLTAPVTAGLYRRTHP